MSKIYRNKDTSIHVLSGKIQSVAEDGLSMVVSSQEWKQKTDEKTNKTYMEANPIDFLVKWAVPVADDTYTVGNDVTVVGYGQGKENGLLRINVEQVLTKSEVYKSDELDVVRGFVKFASYNDEKNVDGTPKLKQDGQTPRKPHFDITVTCRDEENDRWVNHIFPIYNTKNNPKEIERYQKKFANFDAKTNRALVTIVAGPGAEPYAVTKNYNGQESVYWNVRHMGIKSFDMEMIDERTKSKETPTASPAYPSAENTSDRDETSTSSGFDQDFSNEFA